MKIAGLQIRKFADTDEERCCEIIKDCFEKNIVLSDEAKKYIVNKFTQRGYLSGENKKYGIFVCEVSGEVCGMGAIENEEIKKIYVDLDFQGQGIGENVLNYLEDFGKENGVSEFVLHSYDNAVGFYLKHGYEVVGDYEFDFPNLSEKVFVKEMKKRVFS